MLPLLARLDSDLKRAARARDELQVSVLRSVKNALHNQQIALRSREQELPEAEVLKVLRGEAKRRQEAAELYQRGGRPDLANHEAAELKILQQLLPSAPPVASVRQAAHELIRELGCQDTRDIGRLTRAIIERFQGAVDGQTASTLARELLAS